MLNKFLTLKGLEEKPPFWPISWQLKLKAAVGYASAAVAEKFPRHLYTTDKCFGVGASAIGLNGRSWGTVLENNEAEPPLMLVGVPYRNRTFLIARAAYVPRNKIYAQTGSTKINLSKVWQEGNIAYYEGGGLLFTRSSGGRTYSVKIYYD